MAKANPKDRETIVSLRLTIQDALEHLNYEINSGNSGRDIAYATSILSMAYDSTDPTLLDKDCGCG